MAAHRDNLMPKPYFEDKNKKLSQIIMVNHAGEYGAQRIYEGQINYTKDTKQKSLIRHMLEQELMHLNYFENEIKKGASRPTAMMPLWKIFGYGLGAISARIGPRTAMLVTESVEKVIVDHYQEQIDYLEKANPNNPVLQKIKEFKQDEADHIHIALKNESTKSPFYSLLSNIVGKICKTAIFISKKI